MQRSVWPVTVIYYCRQSRRYLIFFWKLLPTKILSTSLTITSRHLLSIITHPVTRRTGNSNRPLSTRRVPRDTWARSIPWFRNTRKKRGWRPLTERTRDDRLNDVSRTKATLKSRAWLYPTCVERVSPAQSGFEAFGCEERDPRPRARSPPPVVPHKSSWFHLLGLGPVRTTRVGDVDAAVGHDCRGCLRCNVTRAPFLLTARQGLREIWRRLLPLHNSPPCSGIYVSVPRINDSEYHPWHRVTRFPTESLRFLTPVRRSVNFRRMFWGWRNFVSLIRGVMFHLLL